MNTRKHVHEEVFSVPPEQLFALLHTPGAIRRWWSAARAIVMPEPGGLWCAAWGESEDDPDYITAATLEVFDPPHRMVMTEQRYFAKTGPLPFEADFTTEYLVTPHPEGAALRVTQEGFPAGSEGDEFLLACEKGWTDTFAGIRNYLNDQQ